MVDICYSIKNCLPCCGCCCTGWDWVTLGDWLGAPAGWDWSAMANTTVTKQWNVTTWPKNINKFCEVHKIQVTIILYFFFCNFHCKIYELYLRRNIPTIPTRREGCLNIIKKKSTWTEVSYLIQGHPSVIRVHYQNHS